MNDDLFSVEGKRCLITGASTGLGAHFARILLERGAMVTGASRSEPDWTPQVGSDRFHHVTCDVTDDAQLRQLFEQMLKSHGGLDVLVNNAGDSHVAKAADVDTASFRLMLDVNVVAAAQAAALAAPLMKDKGGVIINVSSVLASTTMTGLSNYSASKAALDQLTRSQAVEWARWGIRVNALAPGWFPSRMTDPFLSRGLGDVLKSRIPMKRLGEVGDLDGALVLLASKASRYMTGITLSVDGGFALIN